MSTAQLHGIINVLNRANALFQCAYGVQQKRNEQAVDDEAGPVGGANRGLSNARCKRDCVFFYLFVGGDGANYFDQLHDRNRIEKMEAEEAVRALRERGHLRNGKRRSVAREDSVLGANLVECGPQFSLGGQLLDDGFDDQIAIFQVLEAWGAVKAASTLIAIRRRERALVHQ